MVATDTGPWGKNNMGVPDDELLQFERVYAALPWP
jgi:hypothetical protein